MKSKQTVFRYNGIDIIKTLAIIFVPILHFYLNYNFGEIKMLHFHNVLQISVRWVSFSCIGLFIMSSGFLMSNKKISKSYYKKIFYFLFAYFIFIVLESLIHSNFSTTYFLNLVINFFQFGGYFWYVSFYISLYAIIPYLNMVVEKLDQKNYKIFLIILMFLVSVPSFINTIPPYESIKIVYLPASFVSIWPGVYYFIGAYFRKFNPKFSKRRTLLIFLTVLIFVAALNFTYSKGSTVYFVGGGGYGNIISVILTTCIFNLFYDVNLKSKIGSKIFSISSSVTYETYLALGISDIYTRKVMLHMCGNFVSYKYIFIEATINFIIAFILGIIVHYFVKLFVVVFDLKNKV